jgi:predicted Zn-dependent protease
MLLSEVEAKSVCEKLLRATSADDAQVSVSSEDLSHLRFAANDFTTSGCHEEVSATITVWVDRKRGAATASSLEDAALRDAAQEAEELARVSPLDREYVPTLGPQTYKPYGGYAEATSRLDLAERARTMDAIIRQCEGQGVIGAGFHQATSRAEAFATRHGAFHYQPASTASLSVTVRTADGRSSGSFRRDHFDIRKLDTTRVGREAIRKALEGQNPQVLQPGVYPVILEAQAAADLIRLNFDARAAEEGRSAFSAPGGKTKAGQPIFDERINISSDPWNAEVPGSTAAEDGLPAEKLYFVRNGMLENLSYTRFWAEHQHKPPTPGPVNFILESARAPASMDEMIGSTKRGLLLGRFWYIRMVDPRSLLLTGLTRDGVWLIENGKIKHAVSNFRFNQSILDLLAPGNVQMIGATERITGSEGGRLSTLMPALKVKAFHFTSLSEAV